jgi:hypothetical protein
MKLRIIRAKDQKERELVREFAVWAGNQLLGPKLNRNCEITVSFKKFTKVEGEIYEGLCTVIDDSPNPRRFLIHVEENVSLKRKMGIIAHELTHAKQYARRELTFRKNTDFWNGEEMDPDLEYWLQPWEVEAFGQQTCLYKAFRRRNRKKIVLK